MDYCKQKMFIHWDLSMVFVFLKSIFFSQNSANVFTKSEHPKLTSLVLKLLNSGGLVRGQDGNAR